MEKEIKGKMKERKKLSLFGNGMTMHMKFFLIYKYTRLS